MQGGQDSSPASGGGGALESHLRNLIISNSMKDGSSPGPSETSTLGQPTVQSEGTPPTQQPRKPGPIQLIPDDLSETTNKQVSPSQKSGRKRPNQAQRRQMSAQLSIPIDPRPQPPQSARPYISPPGYPSAHQYSGNLPPGNQYRSQRPHSATFRPPNHGHGFPNPPLSGQPFSSQAKHHHSLSLQGPISPPPGEHYDWRGHQHHGSNSGDHRMGYHPSPMPYDSTSPRNTRHSHGNLYNPGKQFHVRPDELKAQAHMLENLCTTIIAGAEIESADIMEKESFRAKIEQVCQTVISRFEQEQNGLRSFPPASVQLKCFGSLSSGFATKAADMDLGLLSPLSPLQPDAPGSPIPRLLEKAFLDMGLGARLLTRTRVPIIKLCEKPPEQLLRDLQEARIKWETGVTDEQIEDDDQNEDRPSSPAEDQQHSHSRKEGSRGQKELDLGAEKTYEEKLSSLTQDKRSLQTYYGLAKGLLRKLGGRDLTNSNAADFSGEDFRVLTDVSLAFVRGLADENLRTRLLNYKSLNQYDIAAGSKHRSLLGVWTQIEGEKMVLMWDTRSLKERDSYHEHNGEAVVKLWQTVQNKPDFGNDPLAYNKELQSTLELVRKLPSVQFMLLSQVQYEPAAAYYSRATKIMLDLKVGDAPLEHDPVVPVVIRQYVQGIYGEEVRNKVREFVETEGVKTLQAVARRHKSLQLAHEYEKALNKGLYPEEHTTAIKAYVELLRSPLKKNLQPDSACDYVVPATSDMAPIIQEIRRLGDPSKLSPNQPRDPYRDRLEFPKDGAGVQCDVNFSAHLALQNTLLLRCYSHSDPRVRPMVLFIKHWARVRGINSPYRGTLSSYGYVLMMLHYLVNVAQPFVCPNLQQLAPAPDPNLTPEQIEETVICKGRDVRFWRDEAEIKRLANDNALTQNRDSIGHLLRGFFEYYAQSHFMSTVQGRGFDWGRDVLSLRTHGGLLTKQEKGWTGAKTVIEVKATAAPPGSAASTGSDQGPKSPAEPLGPTTPDQLASPGGSAPNPPQQMHTTKEIKEVRHRYLFAIEDPFELDHNVARTVTHNGIVAIRDEFRRAWRIIRNASKINVPQDDLLQDVIAADLNREKEQFSLLLDELHGKVIFDE
ncbi:hypothetical protein GQ53DRAFT_187365 [Thozetella sp. PMI_491]|nr:hypothetical protein GQ53DRAFT_187365 [Thozetella sp. PMI_491]